MSCILLLPQYLITYYYYYFYYLTNLSILITYYYYYYYYLETCNLYYYYYYYFETCNLYCYYYLEDTDTDSRFSNEQDCSMLSPPRQSINTSDIVSNDHTLHSTTLSAAIFDDVIIESFTARSDQDDHNRCLLPSFKPVSGWKITWGDLSEGEFTKAINNAYTQVVHWRPNLFKVPSGACGKQFVAELARLFDAFAAESDIEAIALKAAMTLPSLMLQKPHAKSKIHDHISCLQHRLMLWDKGDIADLLKEGKALQKLLIKSQPFRRDTIDNASTARRFSKLMMEGRVRAALKLLSEDTGSDPMSLDEIVDDGSGKSVRDVLEDKHQEPVHAEVLLEEDTSNVEFLMRVLSVPEIRAQVSENIWVVRIPFV